MKKITLLFVLFFVQIIFSQEATSHHVVANGETLSIIAQKYKVTPYDIIKLNPNAVNGVKEKEVLIIPKSLVELTSKPEEKSLVVLNSDDNLDKNQNVVIHIVQSKETKFGLSKIYGLSIQNLEKQNPQIIAGLQVGQKLQIKGAITSFKQNLTQLKTLSTFTSTFDYIVLSGETLYGISKRNGITVDELIKANTAVLNGILKSGQKLSIPVRSESGNLNNSIVASNNSKFHLVEPKETKFGLSKKYGVSIEELENLNPQIVKGLQIGQKLIIPNSYTGTDFTFDKEEIVKVSENQVPIKTIKSTSNQEYISYEIQPKETLFGLSKKAAMTVKEFINLNPKLQESVQVGMIIKMPKNVIITSDFPQAVVVKETITHVSEKDKPTVNSNSANANTNSKYKDLTTTLNKSLKKQITFILPFNETEYKEYLSKSSEFIEVNDDFVKKNLELYSGALRAIDSAKTLGLNFDIKNIELKNDASNTVIDSLKINSDITQSNAVIMPYYNFQVGKVASIFNDKNIPIVTSQLANNDKGFSNLYIAEPSEALIRNTILNYLKSKNANIIVVNSQNRIQSKNIILENYPEFRFVKISDNNVVDIDDLKKLLVKDKLNYVILDTDKSSMIISSTNILLKESTEFKIEMVVLEESLLNYYSNISSIRMNILKMIYPSFSSIEKLNQIEVDSKKIVNVNSKQLSPNFILGFDLTLDTLLRLSQDKNFETSAKEDITEHIKLKFMYKKDSSGTNVNQGFYILQHNIDGMIKVLNQ